MFPALFNIRNEKGDTRALSSGIEISKNTDKKQNCFADLFFRSMDTETPNLSEHSEGTLPYAVCLFSGAESVRTLFTKEVVVAEPVCTEGPLFSLKRQNDEDIYADVWAGVNAAALLSMNALTPSPGSFTPSMDTH